MKALEPAARIRTRDLLLTKKPLCRLSYAGINLPGSQRTRRASSAARKVVQPYRHNSPYSDQPPQFTDPQDRSVSTGFVRVLLTRPVRAGDLLHVQRKPQGMLLMWPFPTLIAGRSLPQPPTIGVTGYVTFRAGLVRLFLGTIPHYSGLASSPVPLRGDHLRKESLTITTRYPSSPAYPQDQEVAGATFDGINSQSLVRVASDEPSIR